jgi:catechol 2,3-dioxygenase-like lactoylglutathione lyase family enzyme
VQVLQSRVLLRPDDFEASVTFYETGIGLVRYRDWGEAPYRGVVYFLGGGFLELTEGGGGRSRGAARPAAEDGEVPPVRLWLQVADVHAAREELVARAIQIADEPDLKPWGLIEMSVHDPDGLELVLIETPTTHPLRRRR